VGQRGVEIVTGIASGDGDHSSRNAGFVGVLWQKGLTYKNIPTPFQGKAFHVGCKIPARNQLNPLDVLIGVAGSKRGGSVESNEKCGETAEGGILTPKYGNANWPAGFPDEPATWSGSVYFRLQYPKRFAHGVVADKEVR